MYHHKKHQCENINRKSANITNDITSTENMNINLQPELNSIIHNKRNSKVAQQNIEGELFNINSTHTHGAFTKKKSYNEQNTPANLIDPVLKDLHMAEKLVGCAEQQQRSAFQFDTITQNRSFRTAKYLLKNCKFMFDVEILYVNFFPFIM